MAKLPAGFRAALLIGWIALAAAGVAYARLKGIPSQAAYPALAAFLIVYPFYLVPAFASLRAQITGWRIQAYVLAVALLPYLACCFGAVEFSGLAFAKLAAWALAMAFWYVVLPRHAAVDLAFLAIIPAVLLGKFFNPIYVPLLPEFRDLIFLGHISLIVMVVIVLVQQRGVPDSGYGFIPSRRDWWIGAKQALLFLVVAAPLVVLLDAVKPPHAVPAWKVAVSFIGFLWVLSLSEEFFIRGVLLHWIEQWTGSVTAALLLSSLVFGLVHLSFGGVFPNYRWVALAGILGWFCGRARIQAGSIRAGMVTHSLVVAARLFVQ
jgi:membrane protease YdiL (CAAX protease family)